MNKNNDQAIHDQPMPTGDGEPVEPRLIALIRERTALGRDRYGTALRTHNGRDANVDALQESLDLNQYLMQRVMELEDAVAGRLPAMTVMHGMEIRSPRDGLSLLYWCDRVIADAGFAIVGWDPQRVRVEVPESPAAAGEDGAGLAAGSPSAPDGSARELAAMEADAEAAAEVTAANGEELDGNPCAVCGSTRTVPAGTCGACADCGESKGCS